jgi:hypothetical protein
MRRVQETTNKTQQRIELKLVGDKEEDTTKGKVGIVPFLFSYRGYL